LVFISDPDREFNDFIFLASNQVINIDSGLLGHGQRDWLKQRLLTIDPAHGFLLTDNLNPLEKLQTRKSEHYRQVIVNSMGIDHFIR
jgi:hypothetical protein